MGREGLNWYTNTMVRRDFLILALVLATAFAFFLSVFGPPIGTRETILGRNNARVTIDFGNGTVRVFEGPVLAGTTILHVLRASAKTGRISFDLSPAMDASGLRIGGVQSWAVWLNNVWVAGPLQYQLVSRGDSILFRYAKN